MKKQDYIKHYSRENQNGRAQLTDRHILMVNVDMKDQDGDPVYKPFLKNDTAISSAREAGWAPATKGLDPTEIKKPVVIRPDQKLVSNSDYEEFLRFKAAQDRKNNPEYQTETEVTTPMTPFENMKTEVKAVPMPSPVKKAPVTPFPKQSNSDGIRPEELGTNKVKRTPRKVTKPTTKKDK